MTPAISLSEQAEACDESAERAWRFCKDAEVQALRAAAATLRALAADEPFLARAKTLMTSIIYRTNGGNVVEQAINEECLRFLHDLDAAHTLPSLAAQGEPQVPREPTHDMRVAANAAYLTALSALLAAYDAAMSGHEQSAAGADSPRAGDADTQEDCNPRRARLNRSEDQQEAGANPAQSGQHSAADPDALVREALQALVDRLTLIHADPEYKSVWTLHQIHNGPYKGPKYADELERARAALATRGGKGE